MERLAERERDGFCPEPAHLQDCCFEIAQSEGGRKSLRVAAGMDHDVKSGVQRRLGAVGEPKSFSDWSLRGIGIDEQDLRCRQSDSEPRHQNPDDACSKDTDFVSCANVRIPQAIQGRLHVRGQHGALHGKTRR